MIRRGIALGRPLVPKLGQRFAYWGGGTPPNILSEQSRFISNQECIERWLLQNPMYSSYDWDSPDLREIIRGKDPSSFDKCFASPNPLWVPRLANFYEQNELQGLGLGKGAGLGQAVTPVLGAGEIKKFTQNEFIEGMFDVGASVASFIAARTTTSLWAIPLYAISVFGLVRAVTHVTSDDAAPAFAGLLGIIASYADYTYRYGKDLKRRGKEEVEKVREEKEEVKSRRRNPAFAS